MGPHVYHVMVSLFSAFLVVSAQWRPGRTFLVDVGGGVGGVQNFLFRGNEVSPLWHDWFEILSFSFQPLMRNTTTHERYWPFEDFKENLRVVAERDGNFTLPDDFYLIDINFETMLYEGDFFFGQKIRIHQTDDRITNPRTHPESQRWRYSRRAEILRKEPYPGRVDAHDAHRGLDPSFFPLPQSAWDDGKNASGVAAWRAQGTTRTRPRYPLQARKSVTFKHLSLFFWILLKFVQYRNLLPSHTHFQFFLPIHPFSQFPISFSLFTARSKNRKTNFLFKRWEFHPFFCACPVHLFPFQTVQLSYTSIARLERTVQVFLNGGSVGFFLILGLGLRDFDSEYSKDETSSVDKIPNSEIFQKILKFFFWSNVPGEFCGAYQMEYLGYTWILFFNLNHFLFFCLKTNFKTQTKNAFISGWIFFNIILFFCDALNGIWKLLVWKCLTAQLDVWKSDEVCEPCEARDQHVEQKCNSGLCWKHLIFCCDCKKSGSPTSRSFLFLLRQGNFFFANKGIKRTLFLKNDRIGRCPWLLIFAVVLLLSQVWERRDGPRLLGLTANNDGHTNFYKTFWREKM